MKRFLLVLAVFSLSPSLWAETVYTYTGAPFTGTVDFTIPCGTGPCANFPPGARITGSFTTADPLPSGLVGANVYPSVESFAFSDGVNTYSNANPNVRVIVLVVSTDGGGNIIAFAVGMTIWQTGTSPHVATNRDAAFELLTFGTPTIKAANNSSCTTVGVSPVGVADTCTAGALDASSSGAQVLPFDPGTWSRAFVQTPVPTLSEWAMVMLSLLVAGFAFLALHRRGG